MTRRWAEAGALAVAILLVACAPGRIGDDDWNADEPLLLHPKAKTGPLYAESIVVDFDIGFDAATWQAFLAAWKPQKDTGTWFHCSFGFDGIRFLDAACRHKGGTDDPSSEKKPRFVVRFDKWDGDGRFLGVRSINLEALPEFAAPVRDRLVLWMMLQAGIPAPRANNARVTVNGEPMGLYLNVEDLDHEFLEQRFDPPIGNLYHQDDKGWHLDTNGSTGDLAPVAALDTLVADWKALAGADSSELQVSAKALLDVGEVLRESAAEMVLPTIDNFSNGLWNFFVYQAVDRRLILMPWTLGEAISRRAPANADPWTFLGKNASGELAQSVGQDLRSLLFESPAWKAEYADDLVAFRDGPYASGRARLQRICEQVRPYVAEDPNAYGTVQQFDAECIDIRDRITQRIEYLKSALGR